jgi:hypothetical protein
MSTDWGDAAGDDDAADLYISGAQTAIKNGFELSRTGLAVSVVIRCDFSSFFFKRSLLPPLLRPFPSSSLPLRLLFRVRFC